MTYFIALKLGLEYFYMLNSNGYNLLNHKLRKFVTSTSVTKLVTSGAYGPFRSDTQSQIIYNKVIWISNIYNLHA